MNENLRTRTEQKLRYAKLHLDELAAMPSGHGHDFERAHHEAVFAQLIGAYHAFLTELNDILICGLDPNGITAGKLRKSLKAKGRQSAVLGRLHQMREDTTCWLKNLLDLRDTSTHISGIPLVFYAGGIEDGKTAFKHPTTLKEFPDDATATLAKWVDNMRSLTDQLRALAIVEAAT